MKEAKAALVEPKSPLKQLQQYEYHEFDEQRYRNISPMPPTPPIAVDHGKSDIDSVYTSDEDVFTGIHSPPQSWYVASALVTPRLLF